MKFIYLFLLSKENLSRLIPTLMPLKITSGCGLALFIVVLGSLNGSVTAGRMLLDKKDCDGEAIEYVNPRDLVDLVSRLFKNEGRDNKVVYGIQLGVYGTVLLATIFFMLNLRSCSGKALGRN
jgi:hypothetical protein